MKLHASILALSILLILFGSIGLSKVMGIWHTQSTKIPIKYTEGEFKGEYNPIDIRGSYSFQDISDVFEIDANDLMQAFAIEKDVLPSEFACKDLETMYANSVNEVGTNSVRVFTALYKGLPIELDEETYFPSSVLDILLKTGNIDETEKQYIVGHLVNQSVLDTPTTNNQGTTSVETFVKGKTTYGELVLLGVKKEDMEAVLKYKIERLDTIIRDDALAKGIEFSTIKDQLNELVLKVKK